MNNAEIYAMELTLRRELEATRRQRDEALQALREIAKGVNDDTDMEKAAAWGWGFANEARRILAQYTEDTND